MADKYHFQLKNGGTLTLEGDSQPSDSEVESIAKQQGVELQPIESPAPKVTPKVESKPVPQPAVKTTSNRKAGESGRRDEQAIGIDTESINNWIADKASRLSPSLQKPVAFAGSALANIGSGIVEGLSDPTSIATGFLGAMRGRLPQIAESALSKEIPAIPEVASKSKANLPPDLVPMGGEEVYNQKFQTTKLVPEDILYENARNRFNMGKKTPMQQFNENEIIGKDRTTGSFKEGSGGLSDAMSGKIKRNELPSEPKAEFLGLQENGEPLYNIVGGPKDKSTVTAQTLKDMGIEAPPVPKDAVPMKGEQLREIALKQRASQASDKPLSAPSRGGIPQFNPRKQTGMTGSQQEFDPSTLKGLIRTGEPKNLFEAQILGEQEASKAIKQLPPDAPPEVKEGLAAISKTNQIGKFASPTQKKSLWAEARDANRAILTSFDFSAAGRQGKPLMMTKAYWNSFDDMFKAWGSENAYKNVMESIESHPNFKPINGESLADRAGLKYGGHEEVFQSNVAEKLVPGVRRSERAYNAFLNKLRSDHFNTMVDDARRMGVDVNTDNVALKSIGSFINDATGRGSLGKLEKASPILNEVFFAPRLMASRIDMYKRWLNPMTYADQNKAVRVQALKSLISTVGFGMAAGELARLAGAQVVNDPNSADFRKIKVSDKTRIDPFSGFQQYAVGASRLLSGKTTSSTSGKSYDLTSGRFGAPTRASVVSQFFKNKLAPIPSFVWSWMEGKDWDGEPFDAKKALLDRTVPIVMQDLNDLYQEDPHLLPYGILPIMGEGIQSYGR